MDIVSYNKNLIASIDFKSIYISRDNGITWTSFSEGMGSDNTFSALAIKPPYIWAIRGFYGNVYRRPLTEIVTGVEESENIPNEFSLLQNYPNPFNPVTEINFVLPNISQVTLEVFNALGQKLATLVDEKRAPGNYLVRWDGDGFPSGVYFYRLKTEGFTKTMKMLLMK